GFFFQPPELQLDELADGLSREARLEGLFERLANTVLQELPPLALALAPRPASHRQADACGMLDQVFALEIAIGPSDGVGIDGELAGQFADAGEEIARLEEPVGNGELHLAGDLFVNRDAVATVDLNKHANLPHKM